jgi:phage-related tail fiber protein
MTEMTPTRKIVIPPTYDERKKALIVQGAARRNGIAASVDIVRDNLHADKLAKNAVTQVSSAAYSAFENTFGWQQLRNGSFTGNLKRFLPLATTLYSIVTRRKLVVPILRGAAVLAGVSAGAYFVWHRKQRARAAALQESAEYPDYVDPGI